MALELSEYIGINDHSIELIYEQPLLYELIYSLRPIELETLKTYIKTNLANSFIRLSKSLAKALIFFDKKPDRSFQLCVNYQDFNNLTIEKQYPLPLIEEFLDQLGQTR